MLLTYDDYTVGWIAALPHELAPAQALLDEIHESLEGLPGDNNTYTLGRMGKHNVVIAALPMGVMGTNAAAKAAKDLIRTFQNIRFGLMVGIGGGVPTGPEDVRLGDIVVSTQQGRSGGVLQYDFGTEIQCDTSENLDQDDFVIKSFLRGPHTSLQTAVASLKSKYLVDGYEYHDIYEEMLVRKPRMKQTFKKPTNDILYKAEYVHRAGAGDDCSTCDISQVVERPCRDESVVHYGLIGSGNQVIRNAILRDKLYRKEKIICFEMEAAGLMKDFECMVIRGICVNNSLRQIAVQNTEIITAQQSHGFHMALAWIAASNPEIDFRDVQKRKDPETGMWLADSPVYIQWKADLKKHLWLHGKAGCGKSVLTTTAISDIQQYCTTEDAAFAMFYFTFSDTRKQSWQDCLKSLVVQLVAREPAVSMLIQAYQASKSSPPNEEFLRRLLLLAIEPHRQVFIAIDALDESPLDANGDGTVRSIVLDNLASLSVDAPHIKFFLTSRDLADIRDSMEALEASSVPMVAECVNRDIMKYVTNQLAKDRKLSRLDSQTKDNIKTTLTTKADGMFRWAYCQLHQLKILPFMRPKDIERALNTLPKSLDETYDRMLNGIDQNLKKEVLTLLRWLAYAQRPLSLCEITETVTIDLDQENSIIDTNNRPQPEEITNLLAGLIIIKRRDKKEKLIYVSDEGDDDDDNDSTIDYDDLLGHMQENLEHLHIQLAHFSVKEYLESSRSVSLPFHLVFDHDQQFLLNCCLAYLMHYAESKDRLETEQDLMTFPLLWYAAESWFIHYVDTGDVQYAVSFLASEKALYSWYRVTKGRGYWRGPFEGAPPRKMLHGLYFASRFGMYAVAKNLIELGADVDASRGASQRGKPDSALAVACREDHEKLVELLIMAGANVNEEENNTDALYYSSKNGNLRIVRMLVNAGANRSVRSPKYRRCIKIAASSGHEQVLRCLIDVAEDLGMQREVLNTSLGTAVSFGHSHIIKTLIDDYGANPEMRCGRNGNALHIAAASSYCEDERITTMLIEDYGVDVNLEFRNELYTTTALQAAIHAGDSLNIKRIKILLDAGADLGIRNGSFNNALHVAMSKDTNAEEKLEAVKLLLDAGADVNAQGGRFGNALQAAARHGAMEVVKLLLDAGAEVNAKGGYYGSALQAAISYQRDEEATIETVKLLLDAGADPNISDKAHRSALYDAVDYDQLEVVKTLITAGAEINAQDARGISVLMFAAHTGHPDIIETLIEQGANINMLDHVGRSAINYAAAGAEIKAYKQLIATRICNLDIKDRLGKTILDYVCISGSAEMLKTFLEVEQHKSLGNSSPLVWSPLHWACRTGDVEVLEMLSNAGFHTWVVETNTPAAKWTPLDIAIYHNNLDLVVERGEFSKSYNWRSLCQSGIVLDSTSSHDEVILYQENSLKPGSRCLGRFCDGCLSTVEGIRFRCQEHKEFKYCFMCKHSLEVIHPDYAWSCIEPDGKEKSHSEDEYLSTSETTWTTMSDE